MPTTPVETNEDIFPNVRLMGRRTNANRLALKLATLGFRADGELTFDIQLLAGQ